MAAAIDMSALRAAAFDGSGPHVVVDRPWLQSVYRALCGEDFVDTSIPADMAAQLDALSTIDATPKPRSS